MRWRTWAREEQNERQELAGRGVTLVLKEAFKRRMLWIILTFFLSFWKKFKNTVVATNCPRLWGCGIYQVVKWPHPDLFICDPWTKFISYFHIYLSIRPFDRPNYNYIYILSSCSLSRSMNKCLSVRKTRNSGSDFEGSVAGRGFGSIPLQTCGPALMEKPTQILI